MAANSTARSRQWLRFSLRGLLATTALVAVALMSLMHATAWVPNLWFSALLLSILIALTCWRGGKGNGFGEGYTLFAGGYAIVLLLSAWPQSNQFMANPNAIHTMLITHSLNDWAFDRVLPLVRKEPLEEELPPGGGGFFGPGPIAQFGGSLAPLQDQRIEDEIVPEQSAQTIPGFPANLDLILAGGQTILDYPDPNDFQRVAHCLWAILIGCVGGRLMQALRGTSQTSLEQTAINS